jgi:hypothetical protein
MPTDSRSAGWIAYNRLQAAVAKHLARSQPSHPTYCFADENDDELHAAYRRVLRDIAPPIPRRPLKLDALVIVRRPEPSDDDLEQWSRPS